MVFEPDDLHLLATTDFDLGPTETLATLRKVLVEHPELAADGAPLSAESGVPSEPAHTALLALEERLAQGNEAEAGGLVTAVERWLADHAAGAPDAAPLAWLLLGQAWYVSGNFNRANQAWSELVRRFPEHPLRHRARYNMLDHGVWPEPAHPSLQHARLPGVGDTGVSVPFPDVRARNMEMVPSDPRYRWSPSGIPFVTITAGTFIMGGNPPGAPRERRLRRVTITRPFLLSAWPVTRAVWRRVHRDAWPGVDSEGLAGELPATRMSWNMAAAFLESLRAQDGWPYRFPTEAEWELAARDGIEGAYYPWGNEPLDETRCNFNQPRQVPVACYPPTRNGLFDMLGNGMELASDLWLVDAYERTPYEVTDPAGPSPEEQPEGNRVSVSSPCGSEFWKIHTRISWRGAVPPNFVSGAYTLRVACDLAE